MSHADAASDRLVPEATADHAPRRPVQPRGERRVAALLDAAAAVIAEVGVPAASVHEIARRAGASLGSLYHFFPSKEALVAALTRRYVDELRAWAEEVRRTPPEAWVRLSPAALMHQLVGAQADWFRSNPAYLAIAAASAGHRPPTDADFEARGAQLLAEIFAARWPHVPEAQRALVVRTIYVMADGVMAEVGRVGAGGAPALLAEFERAAAAYVASYEGA